MSDELNSIELIETPIENAEGAPVDEAKNDEAKAVEATEPEKTEGEPLEEDGDKSLDELPLPGDEDPENKKTIPKWVDKKLNKKDQEILQAQNETALYRAEIERLKTSPSQLPGTIVDPEIPKREAFSDETQFIAAVVAHTNKREAQIAQYRAEQQGMINAEKAFVSKWEETKNLGAEKYEDFDEKTAVLDTRDFPTNRAMAEAIVDSPYKHDIVYFLGSHADEARKIAQLNPVQAVKKIAAIEARFEARKKATNSKAPAPIESIKTNGVKGFDVNSLEELSKNSEKMSQAEFERAFQKVSGKEERWGV